MRFWSEYLIDLNATQAAIRVGYSEKTANEQGARLLAKISIGKAIAEAMEARSERTELTQDMVVEGLLREARFKAKGSSHSARVSAWAHLGKHLSMFAENLNLGAVSVPAMRTR